MTEDTAGETALTPDTMTKIYIKIRDKRAELKASP